MNLPAPLGGVDKVSSAAAMGPQFLSYAFNLIPGDGGLTVRPGYQEWTTENHGVSHHNIRSMLAFTGSHKDGSKDRLFAVTDLGIWQATSSTETPTDILNFARAVNDAGFGSAVVMSTLAGRFLLYCDEENGLHVYTESTDTWAKVSAGVTQTWESETAYEVGNQVVWGGNVYVCDTAGTSGLDGPSGTGTNIADDTARWDYVSAAESNVIGPSLADQQNGLDIDPDDFAHVAVWKSRVWLTEKHTSRAWYLDVDSIFGTATSFNFGAKMQKGGPLVGLWNWSYDGGSGLDTLLVGVSTGGDVVIYEGTDPDYSDTFGLKGCWYVGAVPMGRRFVTDTGGELLILSALGVVPLSRLVVGAERYDPTNSWSARIAPVFSRLFNLYRTYRGWALHVHPTANCLLVIVPVSDSGDTIQLAYSFATKGWFQWRNLPVLSACTWNGELYFGDPDGRVLRQTGTVDNVLWADPSEWDPIPYSGLTAFSNLGNARNKQVQLIRPILETETINAICQATARYDYNATEPTAPSDAASTSGGWDTDLWDEATWDANTIAQPLSGAVGMGRAMAVAFQGLAISKTTLLGFDVQWTEGGTL